MAAPFNDVIQGVSEKIIPLATSTSVPIFLANFLHATAAGHVEDF